MSDRIDDYDAHDFEDKDEAGEYAEHLEFMRKASPLEQSAVFLREMLATTEFDDEEDAEICATAARSLLAANEGASYVREALIDLSLGIASMLAAQAVVVESLSDDTRQGLAALVGRDLLMARRAIRKALIQSTPLVITQTDGEAMIRNG